MQWLSQKTADTVADFPLKSRADVDDIRQIPPLTDLLKATARLKTRGVRGPCPYPSPYPCYSPILRN